MELWADGIDELRASLGVERMVILGHSFGGFVALEYALRHREHLDGLVLCATGPGMADSDVLLANAKARATPDQVAAVIEALTAPAKDDAQMRAGWNKVASLYFHRFDPAIGAAMDEHTIYSASALDFGFGQCLPSWTGGARLKEIGVPTLIVNSADDWIMPLAQSGEALRDGIARSKLVVMERSGHFPFIEEQAAFLATMRGWLATLGAR
jgi:proline iminopeptidase